MRNFRLEGDKSAKIVTLRYDESDDTISLYVDDAMLLELTDYGTIRLNGWSRENWKKLGLTPSTVKTSGNAWPVVVTDLAGRNMLKDAE